jgi:hypothetical protein
MTTFNLALEPEAEYHASAEGVPDNGNNTIKFPFKKALFDPEKLVVDVFPLGPSVTGATPGVLNPETQELAISFSQTGTDAVRVEATVRWSASN